MTVLFTDLSDSTRLSSLLEAEIFAALQDDVRRAFDQAVQRHGGTINQYQGDGLQALFGHPRAGEEDGLRATRAALEVHERVRALRGRCAPDEDFALDVHSGIHSGLVLVREGGQGIAGRFELFGAAPGIAKHLSDLAERDEILVSEETLGPARHLFQTDERRVGLKGRDEPLAVHRIKAATSLRTRFEAQTRRGLVDFIGRQAELRWLRDALGQARQGRARLVVVSAAAGVGKTRLAEEFLRDAEAAGFAVWRGYCESELSAEPLQPFLQMLRMRFDAQGGLSVPALLAQAAATLPGARRPPELAPAAVDAAAQAQQMPAALARLFAALARRVPQALFIDDWQWADTATRQVVHRLAAGTGEPLLLLLATRPLEAGDAQLAAAEVLELGPLSGAEADATIRRLLPQADPFLVASIRRHSGGNPLFLEELCHFAAGTGPGLDALRGGSAWLETLIESRVARLAPQQGELLGAAAVVGNVVPAWLLQALTGCDERHPVVAAMAAQDLLFPGEPAGVLRFKHGITRDVVYGTLGLQQRRDMHAQIARLLRERAGPVGEVEHCEALA
ncbi:MAG: AAA family ATPase, partial [Xenophilus sp.]